MTFLFVKTFSYTSIKFIMTIQIIMEGVGVRVGFGVVIALC